KNNERSDPSHFGRRVCKVLSYGNRKFYRCIICNTRLNTMKRFNEHFRIHSYLKNESHVMRKESKYKRTQVLCKICGQDIPKHTFKVHMFHHSKASKTYYCAICRWKSKTRNVLDRHFQKKHPKNLLMNEKKANIKEVQDYICKFCNVPFSHLGLFKQHMRMHSCIKKCKGPGYNNPTAEDLEEHVELKHDNQARENYSTSTQPKLEILFVDTEMKDHIKDEPEKSKNDKRTRFICKFCPFTANTKTPYRTHLKIHRINGNNAKRCYRIAPKEEEKESVYYTVVMDGKVKAYKCTICSKTMKERYLIRRHVWVHTGQFPMTCVLCKAKIRLKKSMKFHLKKKHNLDILIRDIENDGRLKVEIKDSDNAKNCYTVSPKKEEKESLHYTVVKNGDVKAYKCTICGKTTKERYLMRRHVWVHTGQFPMTCVLCKAKIRLKKSMKFHLKKEHNLDVHLRDIENDGRLKVDIKDGNNTKNCYTVAPKEEEKESVHYTIVMDGEVKAYKCTICGKTRTERYLIRRHVWVHTGQFPMTCVLCKAKIRLKKSMKFHLEKEHNLDVRLRDIENDGRLKVDIKEVNNKEYQRKYVENNRPKVKVEKLDTSTVTAECLSPIEVKPSESNDLTSTVKKKKLPSHTGKLPYSCEICGHKGGTKKIIKNHMRRVHKVNVSTLDIPDTVSELESEEDDLVDSMAESEKFSCVLCRKNFKTHYQLDKHKLIHSDDRPYDCPHCTFKSKNKCVLKAHLFRTHKIRFSVTDIPPRKTSVESDVIVKEEFQVTDANTIQPQTSSKVLQCESCNFTRCGSLTLTRHRKKAHNTYDKSDITLESPEFVSVKEELPDYCDNVNL
ncbi:zinc finger protein, partial [Oryctes borbonicus]